MYRQHPSHWPLGRACIAALLSLAASASALSFCVTINDVCCDGTPSTGEYTVPDGNSIPDFYIFYNTPPGDMVNVSCFDVNGGQETLIWTVTNILCGCGTYVVHTGVGQNHHLRFYVNCKQCSSSCTTGTSTVKIYFPSTNVCATSCEQQGPGGQ